jgi:ComF family protein
MFCGTPGRCQPGSGSQLNNWRYFAQLLCSPVCQLCGGTGLSADICGGCYRDLPRADAACPRCAAALPGSSSDGGLCGECQRRPPPWDAAVAAFRYRFPVDRLVQRLKYDGRLEHGRMLGLLLGRTVRRRPRPDRIVPVPLHVERWRERGFNQAVELARPVARALDVPLDATSCRRRRPTPPLWRLGPAARRRLLEGVFEVRGRLPDLSIAIVDDVLTSGATVAALARALRAAGASRIEVWTVARSAGARPRPGRRPGLQPDTLR